MADLCELADVASALGLPSAEAMTPSQAARSPALISTVSRLFAQEAQRSFAPGTSTVRLRILNGSVRLPERPTGPVQVVTDEGEELTDTVVRGHEVVLMSLAEPWNDVRSFASLRSISPDWVTVTYEHAEPVPDAVRGAVAAIVARYLRVDTATLGAAAGVATDLSTGDYRARLAEWTTQNVALSREEVALARSYRFPSPSAVIGT